MWVRTWAACTCKQVDCWIEFFAPKLTVAWAVVWMNKSHFELKKKSVTLSTLTEYKSMISSRIQNPEVGYQSRRSHSNEWHYVNLNAVAPSPMIAHWTLFWYIWAQTTKTESSWLTHQEKGAILLDGWLSASDLALKKGLHALISTCCSYR